MESKVPSKTIKDRAEQYSKRFGNIIYRKGGKEGYIAGANDERELATQQQETDKEEISKLKSRLDLIETAYKLCKKGNDVQEESYSKVVEAANKVVLANTRLLMFYGSQPEWRIAVNNLKEALSSIEKTK